jgi:hypothetical protein
MSDPTPSVLEVVNDPTYTPLAANPSGDVLATEDGTIIIVSSTLKFRGSHILRNGKWLRTPPDNVRRG